MTTRTPGPGGLGTYFKYLGAVRTPHLLFQEYARRYGDFIRLPAGPKKTYLLSHPDHVREVFVDGAASVSKGRGAAASGRMLGDGLLTTAGVRHDADRAVVEPSLDPGRIDRLGDAIVAEADRRLARWNVTAPLDVYPLLAKVTLPMAVQATLGLGSDGTLGPRVVDAVDELYDSFNAFKVLPSLGPLVRLPLPKLRRFQRAEREANAALDAAIGLRRADPGPWIVGDLAGDGGMTNKETRDQLVQLYGGHRPARVAQSWAMHLLAKNPDIQEHLAGEIETVLGQRLPGGADYAKLPYTRQVWSEVLRFYPPVWILTRRVVRDLPVSGGTLPAGSILFVSEYVVHHDPRWYPDPEHFDPERFSDEAVAGRPEFAYFPFGAGIRGCVGSPFADLEGVLLLAAIVQRWRISTVPGFEPEPLMRVNIRPRKGVLLNLEIRREAAAP
jgi:cytochrome P450